MSDTAHQETTPTQADPEYTLAAILINRADLARRIIADLSHYTKRPLNYHEFFGKPPGCIYSAAALLYAENKCINTNSILNELAERARNELTPEEEQQAATEAIEWITGGLLDNYFEPEKSDIFYETRALTLRREIQKRYDEKFPPLEEKSQELRQSPRIGLRALWNRPPRVFLLYEMLIRDTLCVLVGETGTFKSFIALAIAICVALGLDWLGRKVEQVPVVYAAAEGADGLGPRALAILNHLQQDAPDDTQFSIWPEPMDLLSDDDVDFFIADLLTLPVKPGFVVIDTLHRSMGRGDENSTTDMRIVLNNAGRIKCAFEGATVLFIHHENNMGRMRGSSSLRQGVDTIIEAKRERDRITLSCKKQKDAPEFEPIHLIKRVISLTDNTGSFQLGDTSLIFDLDSGISTGSKADQTKAKMLSILLEQFPAGARAREWQEACENAKVAKSRAFYGHVDDMTGVQIIKEGGLYLPKDTEINASTAKT